MHDTQCIVLQLRKQNEILIVGLDDAQNFSEKNCDCFVVLIPHDAYHLANKNFFYLQKDLLSLNEINHVIMLRIGVLADYADASEKWVIRLRDRTNMYI